MTQIRIASFCEKYGFSSHQIRHATRSGKLAKITNGFIDEEQALQVLVNIQPKMKGVIALQNEVTELKKLLQSTLDLKNYYEAELNKLGIFPPQVAKVPLSPEASMKKLSNHPVISEEWMKDQMQQIPESERMFKSRKIPIPPEAFTSSLPDKE
ncbi:hypothetical protein DJ533_03230 [Acinetobacter defluvii]|uniref:Uncharacterized protein n=1 Tax=Acinetobacter defluvii TaxID=1871111 RepID=A0A2S2F9N6_9GAMM|nr:hypothetical protein [Acinetobacter defluvii]AWL27674.1 hypothetical protein DJ533_03230 [Acinetobacter defluvii]